MPSLRLGSASLNIILLCSFLSFFVSPSSAQTSIFDLPIAGTIRVGRTVSTCGTYATESEQAANGTTFWLEWVNNELGGVINNGSRYLFELVQWSDASDARLTERLYTDMAEKDNVQAFLGPFSTTITLAAVAAARRFGLPIVFGGASDPRLYDVSNFHSFGMLVSSTKRSLPCMQVLQRAGVQSAALFAFNESFQLTAMRGAASQLSALGVNVLWNETLPFAVSDFSNIVARITETKPDLVWAGVVTGMSTVFFPQLRASDYNPQAIVLPNAAILPQLDALLPWEANYVLAGDQWAPSLAYTDPYFINATGFAQRFFARHRVQPTLFSAGAFAAGYVLRDAIERAASLAPADIIAALRTVDLPNTFWGPIQFQATGELNLSTICQQVDQDRNSVNVVAPDALVTSALHYPAIPREPPAPKDNTRKRNAIIIGVTVGVGVLVIVTGVVITVVVKQRYHLVFLSKEAREERDTWAN